MTKVIEKKFRTEEEFSRHIVPLLLGAMVGSGRKVISIPEAPWGYFSNEQVDILLLDVKNKEYMYLELKLSDRSSLSRQLRRLGNCIGIINTKCSDEYNTIFSYTGKDSELERIIEKGLEYTPHWRSIYVGFGMIYYWAYKDEPSRFNGGRIGGAREKFANVYMKAIENLHKEHPHLNFMITHAALANGYSVSVSKKYYRKVIKTGSGD